MSELIGALIGDFLGFLIGLLILVPIALVFRWLWSSTIPEVFASKSLSFGPAFRILILASILFGGGTQVLERGHEVVAAGENATHEGV